MRYLFIALFLSGCSSIPFGSSEPAKKYSSRAIAACGGMPTYEYKNLYTGWFAKCSNSGPRIKIGTVGDVWLR